MIEKIHVEMTTDGDGNDKQAGMLEKEYMNAVEEG